MCFSPTGFPSRMLKKPASIVLASFRGSTLSFSEAGNTRGAFPLAKTYCKGERPHTMCGTYLLASSLATALPGGIFEHPAHIVRR